MIKKLLNYIRREDEIESLRLEAQKLQSQINRMIEINANQFANLHHSIMAIQAREELLTGAVVELQEKNIYEH